MPSGNTCRDVLRTLVQYGGGKVEGGYTIDTIAPGDPFTLTYYGGGNNTSGAGNHCALLDSCTGTMCPKSYASLDNTSYPMPTEATLTTYLGPRTTTVTVPATTIPGGTVNMCCHSPNANATCCWAMKGSTYEYVNNVCQPKPTGASVTLVKSGGAGAVSFSVNGSGASSPITLGISSHTLVANLNDDRDVFVSWSTSNSTNCSLSSTTAQSTTLSVNNSSGCTITATIKQQYEADVYGACGTCAQYLGSGGCQPLSYYSTTTPTTMVPATLTCGSYETMFEGINGGVGSPTVEDPDRWNCCVNNSKLSAAVACSKNMLIKAPIWDKFKTRSSAANAIAMCQQSASNPKGGTSSSNCRYLYNLSSPSSGYCKTYTNTTMQEISWIGMYNGQVYQLTFTDDFDTTGCQAVYQGGTSYSYTSDCTGNARHTIKVLAGTGISSVTPTLWQRMWKGAAAKSISATVANGKTFEKWTVSGGCSVACPTCASTKVSWAGTSTECTVTASAIDTPPPPTGVSLTLKGSPNCKWTRVYNSSGTVVASVIFAITTTATLSPGSYTVRELPNANKTAVEPLTEGSCSITGGELLWDVSMSAGNCKIWGVCIGEVTEDCPPCPPYPCQPCKVKQ